MNQRLPAVKRCSFLSLSLFSALCAMSPANAATYQWRMYVPGVVAAPVAPSSPATPTSVLELKLGTASLPAAKVGTPLTYDFTSLLSATGDPAYSASHVSWTATNVPMGMTFNGGILSGAPESAGSATISVTASFNAKSVTQTYVLDASYYSSCKALLEGRPATTSGNYVLDVDGAGAVPAMSYYCDMSSSGGGWTMIVQQYSLYPVASWAGGTNGSSFTLAASNIPSHTQVGFGQGNSATFIDYVSWTYTTGDIPLTTLRGMKNTGNYYQVHRSAGGFYNYHNPEDTFGGSSVYWVNTMTFDMTGGRNFTWAFAPNAAPGYGVNAPGYAINGVETYTKSVSLPWTVWVR